MIGERTKGDDINQSTLNKVADIYYDSYHASMPRRLKDKISMEMLQNIFEKMVVPALEGAVKNNERLVEALQGIMKSYEEYRALDGVISNYPGPYKKAKEALARMEKEEGS